MISMIVATDINGAIGRDNDLLFHIKEDLQRFRQITSGKTVVMGRKTKDSLPKGYLPNRHNIIISRSTDEGVEYINETTRITTVNNLEDLINKLTNIEDEIFVIGGGTIYQQFMQHTTKIYLTQIYAETPSADTYFPTIIENEFTVEYKSDIHVDEPSGLQYQFINLVRGKSVLGKGVTNGIMVGSL